jgi:hypothetical protein
MSVQQLLQPETELQSWSQLYMNKATTEGFQLSASPTAGYVLTSDAKGNGSWQAASSDLSGTYASVGYVSTIGQALTINTTPTVISVGRNIQDAVSSNMTPNATGVVCALSGNYLINASLSFANQGAADTLTLWVAASGFPSNQQIFDAIPMGTITSVNFTTIMNVSAGNQIQIFGDFLSANRACTIFSWNISATKMF